MNGRVVSRFLVPWFLALVLLLLGRDSSSVLAQGNPAWRGEYYNNASLSGNPVLVRHEAAIQFNWGSGAPSWEVPADHFSVRWTAEVTFPAGRYRFTTESDDGVRLFVDGVLVLDQWREMATTTHHIDRDLTAGVHAIRLEYYEARGGAVARLGWSQLNPTATWRSEYYNNTTLSGGAVLVRDEPALNFNWAHGSPAAGVVGVDRFSARFSRTIAIAPGTYRFTATHDDGLRLWVDGALVINEWYHTAPKTHTAEVRLDGAPHQIRVEYYENGGQAVAQLAWALLPPPPPKVGNLISCTAPAPSYAWIKVYQLQPNGSWLDLNPQGYGSIEVTGWLKVAGLPVDHVRYGAAGHPYRVEQWVDGQLIRSVGATERGEAPFRIRADQDNLTPWQCPPR